MASSGQHVGDLVVSGGALNSDYTYNDATHVITINSSTPLTISGSTKIDKIVIKAGVDAHLTLSTLSISVSGSPIDVAKAKLHITLEGANTLHSSSSTAGAGIHVPGGASLTIDGSGSLNACGGANGAAIGSIGVSGVSPTTPELGGKITISSGDITAEGAAGAAAIGGGNNAGSGTIEISGGFVTASPGMGADGIGHGAGSSGSGTFFTGGKTGKAIIDTTSISDTSQSFYWGGIIFTDDLSQVYGNQTLTSNLAVPSGRTLNIPGGTTLTINQGVTFRDAGYINNDGSIENHGTLKKVDAGGYEGKGSLVNESAVKLSFSSNPVDYGKDLSLIATVSKTSVSDFGSTIPAGSVSFLHGDTNLGSASLTPGYEDASAILNITTADAWKKSGLQEGTNNLKVSFSPTKDFFASEGSASLTVITPPKPTPAAPTLSGVDETGATKGDGHITGLTTSMEYKTSAEGIDYTPVTSEDMNFKPGTYWVRLAGTADANPSPDTRVVINAGPKAALNLSLSLNNWVYGATPSQPILSGNAGGGKVSYSYTLVGGTGDYSSTLPTNAGHYMVKADVAATDAYLAGSAKTDFTITPASQPMVDVSGVAASAPGKNDGKISGLSIFMEYSSEKTGTYTKVTDKDMLFAPGTYWVRAVGDENHYPSDPAKVTIGDGSAPAPAPVYPLQTLTSVSPDHSQDHLAELYGHIEEGAWLEAVPLSAGNAGYDKLAARATQANQSALVSYDVTVHGKYQGPLELSLYAGLNYNGKSVTLYHAKADGSIESIPGTVEEGWATFEVDSLSPYLLAVPNTTPAPSPTPSGGGTTPAAATTQAKASAAHSAKATPAGLAQTGDSLVVPLSVAAIAVIGGALVIACVVRNARRNAKHKA